MPERLLIGVLGNRNSGKSHTWNTLFRADEVRTGKWPRRLELRTGEFVEVFLVSGSPEEREKYVGDILGDQTSRIVLCSMQYADGVDETLDYFIDGEFFLYIQWLNPGYEDPGKSGDDLDLVDKILSERSVFSIRDGKRNADERVQEIREFIYGWAKYRNLIY